MFQDVASLEASILSLDAKSMMVLSKLHETKTDEEIIQWSGLWNYTKKDVQRAMQRISIVFGLEGISCPNKRRKIAAEKFVAYSQFRNSDLVEQHTPYTKEASVKDFQNEPPDSAAEISIDIVSPVATRIKRLTEKRQKLVRCIVSGFTNSEIANELGLKESTVAQNKSVLFSELKLPRTLGRKNRLKILEQAWALHLRTKKPPVAESFHKPPPDVPSRVEPKEPQSSEAPEAVVKRSAQPRVEGGGGSLPAIFFDEPDRIVAVQVIPAAGIIPANLIAEGYRSEALIAGHGKSSQNADAFLVMVLRK